MIIGTLESGGGIVSMDEKINRGQAAKAERESANQPAGPPGGPPGKSGQPPGKGHDKKK